MKKLITLTLILFAFNAKGQSNFTLVEEYDTIPKIALITNDDDNLAWQINIFEVVRFESKVSPCNIIGCAVYHGMQVDAHVCYLTEDKKPIPSHWVIWQVK